MNEAMRWSGRYEFEWKSILTYASRKAEFLEWVESGVDVAAFVEDESVIGVAPAGTNARILTMRDALWVELRSPGADIQGTRGLLDGIQENFAPKEVALTAYRSHWTVPLGVEYDEARSLLASRLFPVPLSASGAVPLDGAYLMDFQLGDDSVLAEFGIVDPSEAVERVVDPGNRLGGRPLPATSPAWIPVPSAMPSASLYIDVQVWPSDMYVESLADVTQQLESVDANIRDFVLDVASTVR